jgi:hypothetical protein
MTINFATMEASTVETQGHPWSPSFKRQRFNVVVFPQNNIIIYGGARQTTLAESVGKEENYWPLSSKSVAPFYAARLQLSSKSAPKASYSFSNDKTFQISSLNVNMFGVSIALGVILALSILGFLGYFNYRYFLRYKARKVNLLKKENIKNMSTVLNDSREGK